MDSLFEFLSAHQQEQDLPDNDTSEASTAPRSHTKDKNDHGEANAHDEESWECLNEEEKGGKVSKQLVFEDENTADAPQYQGNTNKNAGQASSSSAAADAKQPQDRQHERERNPVEHSNQRLPEEEKEEAPEEEDDSDEIFSSREYHDAYSYSIEDVDAFLKQHGFDVDSAKAAAAASAAQVFEEYSFVREDKDNEDSPEEESHQLHEAQDSWLSSTRIVHSVGNKETTSSGASSTYHQHQHQQSEIFTYIQGTTTASGHSTGREMETVTSDHGQADLNDVKPNTRIVHNSTGQHHVDATGLDYGTTHSTSDQNMTRDTFQLGKGEDNFSGREGSWSEHVPEAGIQTHLEVDRMFGRPDVDGAQTQTSVTQTYEDTNRTDDHQESNNAAHDSRHCNADKELVVSRSVWENLNDLIENHGFTPLPLGDSPSHYNEDETYGTISESDVVDLLRQVLEEYAAAGQSIQDAALSGHDRDSVVRNASRQNSSSFANERDLQTLQKQNKDLENKLRVAKKEKERNVGRLQNALEQRERALAAANRRVQMLEDESTAGKQAMASKSEELKNRVAKLEKELQERDTHIKHLKDKANSSTRKQTNSESDATDISTLKHSLQEARNNIVECNREIDSLKTTLQRKSDELERTKYDLSNQLHTWRQHATTTENLLKETMKQLKLTVRSHSELISKRATGGDTYDDARSLARAVDDVCQEYKKQLTEYKHAATKNSHVKSSPKNDEDAEKRRLRDRVQSAEAELETFRNSNARLQSVVDKYEDVCDFAQKATGNTASNDANLGPETLLSSIKSMRNKINHLLEKEAHLEHRLSWLKSSTTQHDYPASSGNPRAQEAVHSDCAGNETTVRTKSEASEVKRLKRLLRQAEAKCKRKEYDITKLKSQLSVAVRRSQGLWKSGNENVQLTESLNESIGDRFQEYSIEKVSGVEETKESTQSFPVSNRGSKDSEIWKQNDELNKSLRLAYARIEEKDKEIDNIKDQLQRDRNKLHAIKEKDQRSLHENWGNYSEGAVLSPATYERRIEKLQGEISHLRDMNNALTDALTRHENQSSRRHDVNSTTDSDANTNSSAHAKLIDVGLETQEGDGDQFPHLRAKRLEQSQVSLVEEIRRLKHKEQCMEKELEEIKNKLQESQSKEADLQEKYDNVYLELESRPTINAWHEAQSQLQNLELELEAAVELGIQRERLQKRATELLRESKDRRKLTSTRVLIAKDKRAHELGLKRTLEKMSDSNARQILKDCCVTLSIDDAEALPAAVRSLKAVTDAIPKIEGFTMEICRLVQLYKGKRNELFEEWKQFFNSLSRGHKTINVPHFQRSSINFSAAAGSDTFYEVLTQVGDILKDLDSFCVKEAFASVLLTESKDLQLVQTITSSDQLADQGHILRQSPYMKFIQESDRLFSALQYGNSLYDSMQRHEALFNAAEGALKETEGMDSRIELLQSIILYFQQLFGVDSLQGCFSSMNSLYQFHEEMKNFLSSLKRSLGKEAEDDSLHRLIERVQELRE
eukprot:gb/GECG01009882.1/.p1 GENE.gb/GECG01009882.1/~~gb/GECG01009882.1/.p1  ORF type:complete len:1511 (+),score=293.16 gb/GECG01009882.1/:1-4533(+)